MSMEKTGGRYDRTTITLHWLTAGLVVVLWVLGQTADWFPRGVGRQGAWSVHVVLGFALALVLVARVVWRAGPGRGLPAADPGLLHLVAKLTHYLLYALLVTVVLLGVANAFIRGYHLFGTWALPQIGDRTWRRPVNGWHELAANGIMIVALVHAAAALAHHYLWKDGVLQRMMPARG